MANLLRRCDSFNQLGVNDDPVKAIYITCFQMRTKTIDFSKIVNFTIFFILKYCLISTEHTVKY